MFKATIVFIFANHWLYQLDSLPSYSDSASCYNSMMHHIQVLPQEWLDQGLGVHSMNCEFVPMPRVHPGRK